MTTPRDRVPPPRIAAWLIQLFAPDEAEWIVGDLLEEYSHLLSQSGAAFARRWYGRQTRKTIVHLAASAFRSAPWLIAAAVIGGFLLNRFVSGLGERAIFAVIRRYRIFDHHFSAYVFLATCGIAIGHVISSYLVGCAVALAAKRREMVATSTLAAILSTMTGAAMVVGIASGQASMLWMLPWYLADQAAIVAGGAIVRTYRSTAKSFPSAA